MAKMMVNAHGEEHAWARLCDRFDCTPVSEVKEESMEFEFEITTLYGGGRFGWEWKASGPSGEFHTMGRYGSRNEAKKGAERWCDTKAKQERGPETYKYKAKVT